MHKQIRLACVLPLVVIVFISCKTYHHVNAVFDLETNFHNYKSFAWLPDMADSVNTPKNNSIVRNNMRNYFGKSFVKKGLTLQTDSPDVLLQIVIFSKYKSDKIIFIPSSDSYYLSRYYYGSDFYSPYPSNYYYAKRNVYCYPSGYCTETIEYIESSITLNMIDREAGKLVWTCTAKGELYDKSLIDKNIHPALRAIIKKYPIKNIQPNKKISLKAMNLELNLN